VYIDIGLSPSAETDEGSRSSGGGDACSGHTEDQVYSGVEVEEEHNGRGGVGEESHKEENDAVLEEELPEGRTTRGHEETGRRNNENNKIEEHGYENSLRPGNKKLRVACLLYRYNKFKKRLLVSPVEITTQLWASGEKIERTVVMPDEKVSGSSRVLRRITPYHGRVYPSGREKG